MHRCFDNINIILVFSPGKTNWSDAFVYSLEVTQFVNPEDYWWLWYYALDDRKPYPYLDLCSYSKCLIRSEQEKAKTYRSD